MASLIIGRLIVFGIPLFIVVMLFLKKGKLLLTIGKNLGLAIVGITFLIVLFVLNYVVVNETLLVVKGNKTMGTTGLAIEKLVTVSRKGPNGNRYQTQELRYIAKVRYQDTLQEVFETEIYVPKTVYDERISGEKKLVYYNPKNPKESTVSTPFRYIYGVGIPYFMYCMGALVTEVLIIGYFLFRKK